MSYNVKIAPNFKQEAKKIAKKHKSVLSDIAQLITDLQENPTIGISLGQNIYKIGLAISGTNKGKSGGARVITYVFIYEKVVLLAAIYLKNEHDAIDTDILIQDLKDQGLI